MSEPCIINCHPAAKFLFFNFLIMFVLRKTTMYWKNKKLRAIAQTSYDIILRMILTKKSKKITTRFIRITLVAKIYKYFFSVSTINRVLGIARHFSFLSFFLLAVYKNMVKCCMFSIFKSASLLDHFGRLAN